VIALIAAPVAAQCGPVPETTALQHQEPPYSYDGNQFGASCAIDGTTAVIGAIEGADESQPFGLDGAAYVFTRTANVWTQSQRLEASNGAVNDGFGASVALTGTRIAVGAPARNLGPAQRAGAVYIFEQSGSWAQVAYLTPDAADAVAAAEFGRSVALVGDLLVVGVPGAPAGALAGGGAVYVYQRSSGGVWNFARRLVSPAPQFNARFGRAIALSGTTLLAGTEQHDPTIEGLPVIDAGAAFVFDLSDPNPANWTSLHRDARRLRSEGERSLRRGGRHQRRDRRRRRAR